MRMPPLPADSIHARACKLKCEKILTRPRVPALSHNLKTAVYRHIPKAERGAGMIVSCPPLWGFAPEIN